MVRLRTLGCLSLSADGRSLGGAAGQRRPLAMLAALASAGTRGVTRERLQALLWPESDAERARKVLAQTVYALRRDLGDPGVVLGTTELRLNPELVWADVVEFSRALEIGEPERAVALYLGPFLEGVHIGEGEFERWAEGERARLSRQAIDALDRLARAAEACGDWEVAAGWWRRLAVLDPLSGRVATCLMTALANVGDAAGALRHARVHEALLLDEVGAPPDPAVVALAQRLRTPQRAVSALAPGPTMLSSVPDPLPALPALPAATVSPDVASVVAAPAPGRGHRTWWRMPLPWLAFLVAAIVGMRALRSMTAVDVDRTLVVVVPFDVADPTLQQWRDGIVDVLSRNLDGAGPLRTASPTVVVRRWEGRADRPTVRAFARDLGAGTAIYGTLLHAGPDSVRAALSVLDVRTAHVLAAVRRADGAERMDRLTDSLTFDVLRILDRAIPDPVIAR